MRWGEGMWGLALFSQLYLALLLGVTTRAAPFFFALFLGGMVEVRKKEKKHEPQELRYPHLKSEWWEF